MNRVCGSILPIVTCFINVQVLKVRGPEVGNMGEKKGEKLSLLVNTVNFHC